MIVFTFPGQGSQKPGMGASWVDHPSWELVAEASEAAIEVRKEAEAIVLDVRRAASVLPRTPASDAGPVGSGGFAAP